MRNLRNLRNVAIVGDRNHGKTSLVRAMAAGANSVSVSETAPISSALSGTAEVETTLVVTSLLYTDATESDSQHLIHLVDTPGSLDYIMDLDAALALVDGVVVVVDFFDGVGLLTERTIEKAVALRKKMILLLNKLDDQHGVTYDACVAAVEAVNTVVRRVCTDPLLYHEWELNPTLGNVVFGSAIDGNCFFGNVASASDSEIATTVTDDAEAWIHVQSYKSLAEVVLATVVRHVPSPLESPPHLLRDGVDEEWVDAVRYCDPNGPLVIHIVKLIVRTNATNTRDVIAIGRVLSGTVSTHQEVSVLTRCICDDTTMERRFPDGFQHDTTRITAITPSGDPLGLEKGLDIPAGNLCALSGVDDSLYKSGFITTSEPNAIMASRFFQTYVDQAKPPSVLRVIIYPSQPDDTRTLLTAMQNVLRTDLASECYLTDSGDIVLTAVTTNHLQRCLTRLQIHLQPDIPYRVSDPFVFYQETITTSTHQTMLVKSPNKHLRFYCTAEPLDAGLLQEWTSPLLANQDLATRATRLTQVHGWSERDAHRIVGDPSTHCGLNVLVDQAPPMLHGYLMKEPMRRGLMFAAFAGVLCEEPIVGMRIDVVDAAMSGMERHWNPAQGLVSIRAATYACLLASSPALLEPMFMVEIRWQELVVDVASLIRVIRDRRGRVMSLDEVSRRLRVLIPVRETVGLEEALGIFVRGDTIASMEAVVDRYERIEGDPLNPTTLAGIAVRELRVRKCLDPEIPPLSRFHHKL